jgi:hypothetical protein
MSAHKIARVITFVTKPKLTIIHVRYTRVSSTLDKKSKHTTQLHPSPKHNLAASGLALRKTHNTFAIFTFEMNRNVLHLDHDEMLASCCNTNV